MKQREIKSLIKTGIAKDITYSSFDEINKLIKDTALETIAVSSGTYGMNGALFRDVKTGTLYAIGSRTNALFQLV